MAQCRVQRRPARSGAAQLRRHAVSTWPAERERHPDDHARRLAARRGVRAAPRCRRSSPMASSRSARSSRGSRALVALDRRRRSMFEGGVTAYPPGSAASAPARDVGARAPRAQLDGTLADVLVRELAGVRLSIRDRARARAATATRPTAACSPRSPSRAGSIRSGRSRARRGSGCSRSSTSCARSMRSMPRAWSPTAARRAMRGSMRSAAPRAARRLLGLDGDADLETIKRAYRQARARAVIPISSPRPMPIEPAASLERRFAESHRGVRSAD